MISKGFRILISVYQGCLSPLLHLFFGPFFGCRFIPTCSEYASEALHSHGWKKGTFLLLKRISRCHPFTQAGYDPVPRAIETIQYPI